MTVLDKNSILSANDLPHEDVEVPEWGGSVRVRCITAADRYALVDTTLGTDGKIDRKKFILGMLAAAIVDENGDRLFSDEEMPALAKKSYTAIDRLINVTNRLNGLAGEQEVIEKN